MEPATHPRGKQSLHNLRSGTQRAPDSPEEPPARLRGEMVLWSRSPGSGKLGEPGEWVSWAGLGWHCLAFAQWHLMCDSGKTEGDDPVCLHSGHSN